MDRLGRDVNAIALNGQQHYPHRRQVLPEKSLGSKDRSEALGVPATKKRLQTSHGVAAIVSLTCLALAVTAVANEHVSWHLGQKNYQLIVVGLLLSIMNLSFASVTPAFFLHLEAQYGRSTLQNYDGILRNSIVAPKLSILWRLILGSMTALPVGLSVIYKIFIGGQSAIVVDPFAHIGNTSYYGMFAPPGIQSLGERTGISLFSNATLPFMVAASPSYGGEPPLPHGSQAFGFNLLYMDNSTAAVLDIPQPDYVTAVQELLAPGESWEVSANVAGIVAQFNNSMITDQESWNSTLMQTCEDAVASSGAYQFQPFLVPDCLTLLDSPSTNQSFQYLGFLPCPNADTSIPGDRILPPCWNFSHYAERYDITRRPCTGSWIITRGSIQLSKGSCAETLLPPEKQVIVSNISATFLNYFYMPTLTELLGAFATTRNGSDWERPFTAMGLAAMMWSRIVVMHGAGNIGETHDTSAWEGGINNNLTLGDAGLIYPIDDVVQYTRPTLKKSSLLYCALGLQPMLILICLALMGSVLYSTPVDKGFGLMSILSGIDRRSLDVVSGASLSGELREHVRLVIRPTSYHQGNKVRCLAVPYSSAGLRNKRLSRKTTYH